MGKKKQKWDIGSVFKVKLCDGTFVIGLVIGIEPQALNSFIGAFYLIRITNEQNTLNFDIDYSNPVTVQFVTRDLLDSGVWEVINQVKPINVNDYFPMSELVQNGFVGVKIIGSGIIIKLLEALFGLYPWDGFAKPDYLDGLLVNKKFKPTAPLLKSS